MSIRIAVVQFQIAHLDRQTNLERMEGFIKNAASQSAQVTDLALNPLIP